jgi:outer membrane receptor for ferric coprogen and ferric-rhodotorulic acid
VSRLDTGSALSVWGSFLDKQYETGSSIPLRPDGTFVNVNGGREAFYGSKDTSSARRMAWTAARLEHTVTPRVSLQSTLHYRRTKSHADLDFYDHFGFQPERNVMTVNGFDAEVTDAAMYTEGVATITLPTARVLIGGNFERTAIDEIDRWSGQYGFTFACGFTFFAIEIDYTTGAVLNCNHPCFEQDAVRTIADTTNRFGSVFAQADLELGARATVTLGGRYDRFNRRSEITAGDPLVTGAPVERTLDKFNPKASLTVDLGASQTACAAFGQGFNTNFGPAWQWDPSRYIRREKPTTLRNYEAGVKGSVGGTRLSYALSAFRIDQRDRLIFVSNPDAFFGSGLPDTIATTGQRYETRGVELTTRVRPRTGTSIDINYGWLDATWKELLVTDTLDLSGTTPTGVPAHVFSAGNDQSLSARVSLRLGVEAYSDYFVTQDNTLKGGAYQLVNLGVT